MNFNILDKSTCTMMGAISRIQASLGGSGCCAGVGGPRSLGNFRWSCWWKTALELKVYIYIYQWTQWTKMDEVGKLRERWWHPLPSGVIQRSLSWKPNFLTIRCCSSGKALSWFCFANVRMCETSVAVAKTGQTPLVLGFTTSWDVNRS